jgi:hypothetical protein
MAAMVGIVRHAGLPGPIGALPSGPVAAMRCPEGRSPPGDRRFRRWTVDGTWQRLLYAAQERIDREEIYRLAVAAELPSDDIAVLDRLLEG